MKALLLISTMTLAAISSSTAFALDGGHNMMANFGPELTMQVNGHDMHFQAIRDKAGHEFIVIGRADAEAMMGHKMDGIQFREINAQTR